MNVVINSLHRRVVMSTFGDGDHLAAVCVGVAATDPPILGGGGARPPGSRDGPG